MSEESNKRTPPSPPSIDELNSVGETDQSPNSHDDPPTPLPDTPASHQPSKEDSDQNSLGDSLHSCDEPPIPPPDLLPIQIPPRTEDQNSPGETAQFPHSHDDRELLNMPLTDVSASLPSKSPPSLSTVEIQQPPTRPLSHMTSDHTSDLSSPSGHNSIDPSSR